MSQSDTYLRFPRCWWLAVLLMFGQASEMAWSAPRDAKLSAALGELLRTPGPVPAVPPRASAAIADFYARRNYRPYWVHATGPGAAASAMITQLRDAIVADALTADPPLPEEPEGRGRGRDATELARLELELTNAFRTYGGRLANGDAERRRSDRRWHIQATPLEPLTRLKEPASAADMETVIAGLRPPHLPYARLRKAYQHYRELVAWGGWPSLPSGPTLESGIAHPQVGVLRERLARSGDLPASEISTGGLFDATLRDAVLRFQRRHGLAADGRVGRATRAALNVTASERARQIASNLERWRWMPRQLGRRYLLVNVAGFQIEGIVEDRTLLAMRVIAGMRSRATPAFSGTLDRFILNPLWYVPRSIATRDLLPKQRKDPGYLPRKSIRVFADAGRTRELDPAAIDWTRVSAADFPYFLRQDPGPGNSLGRIKFPVSNPFGIFLHDTPNPALFEKPNRALSSGCIRLEDPAAVAAFVRNDAENWPASRIRELMDRGEAQVVRLPESVPVYVAYFTAWVDQQDTVQFRTDLYGRNARIATCDCGKDPGCR